MAEIIRMPKMSDTMEEGVIAAWLKKVGDEVKPGDILPRWKLIKPQWNWSHMRKVHCCTLA